MQAYKQSQCILNYYKFLKKKKIFFPKFKGFTNCKIRVLIDSRS